MMNSDAIGLYPLCYGSTYLMYGRMIDCVGGTWGWSLAWNTSLFFILHRCSYLGLAFLVGISLLLSSLVFELNRLCGAFLLHYGWWFMCL